MQHAMLTTTKLLLQLVGGSLGMYIKKYIFLNSAGQVAPPVYVIGDDSLGPEDCLTFKVTGLSNINAVDAYGYLVFCQSRAGNDSFYVWYVTTVVLPFVMEVREHLGADGLFPNGHRMAAFVSRGKSNQSSYERGCRSSL